ncbi:MAG TPA: ethanolamine ammonia-lyase reactivating factor EutA, partial [Candidatus Binatia bacterium]|nr:ethanolamine ammonia-lyase reactivating factor EutA [Candidatus Binatia bacterium]
LVAYDPSSTVTRVEEAGHRFLDDLGCDLQIGDKIAAELRGRVAARMAHVLFDVLEGGIPPWDDLFITSPLRSLPQLDGVLFSGGVSEYIYGRERAVFGDLGPYLGRQIKEEAEKRGFRVVDSGEGIRATVIGASQYSVQLSGETIFVPDGAQLPVRNLRVFVVHVDWEAPIVERTVNAVRRTLQERDPEVCGSPFALVFSSPPFLGYGAAQELAKGIDQALAGLDPQDRPQVLVFEQNVGRIVGGILSPNRRVPCVDEIILSELDFIDVGEVVEGEGFVPVVIKSLTFGL